MFVTSSACIQLAYAYPDLPLGIRCVLEEAQAAIRLPGEGCAVESEAMKRLPYQTMSASLLCNCSDALHATCGSFPDSAIAVSYTHLTLPTILLV